MIFISAGHHNKDSGAVGCGFKEADLTKIMRDLVCKELDSLSVKYTRDDDGETLSQYLNRIKTGEGSVVLEFHFNASDNKTATGVETLIADNPSTDSYSFAKDLNNATVRITGLKDRGVKTEGQSHRGKLGIMREQGIVALIELAFISNCNDVKVWSEKKEELAKEYAKILIKYENLK